MGGRIVMKQNALPCMKRQEAQVNTFTTNIEAVGADNKSLYLSLHLKKK